jgi:hypothetical protein
MGSLLHTFGCHALPPLQLTSLREWHRTLEVQRLNTANTRRNKRCGRNYSAAASAQGDSDVSRRGVLATTATVLVGTVCRPLQVCSTGSQ